MAVKASISSGYRWRLFAISLVCLLFAGWSSYDGFVKYPEINRVANIYENYKEQHPNWDDTWQAYAAAEDLPEKPKQEKSDFSLYAQYVQMAIALPIGLLFGFGYLSNAGRWVAADEEAVTSSRGQKMLYGSIRRLNKERWTSKGIAVVYYDSGEGEDKIVLDDWKYSRPETDQILLDIEARITDDKIIGGDREPVATDDTGDEQQLSQDEGPK